MAKASTPEPAGHVPSWDALLGQPHSSGSSAFGSILLHWPFAVFPHHCPLIFLPSFLFFVLSPRLAQVD